MIEFVCDSCLRVRRPQDAWILGLAAEARGVTAACREVTILSGWDRDRALPALAVHFCSASCKHKYLKQLFGTSEDGINRRTTARSHAKKKTAKKRAA